MAKRKEEKQGLDAVIAENQSLNDLPNEIWKDIPNYEGLYQVSNLGRVKSLERDYKSAFVRKMPQNIKKQKINKRGYYYLHLCKNGKKWATTVHKLVVFAFIGPKPYPDVTINHKDSNKLNNRLENLEYCSIKENNRHYRDNVIDFVGEDHPMAKLTEKDVISIRNEYSNLKTKQKDIAAKYGVTQVMISRIILRKAWSHI